MRVKSAVRKVVALVLLSIAAPGALLAQSILNVGSTAAVVADIGYAEPAGNIVLAVYSGTTVAAPLALTYSAPIANNAASEIRITGTGGLAGIQAAPVLNRQDNSITINIPAGGTVGDQIIVSGVRVALLEIHKLPVTAEITNPSGSGNFIWAGQSNPIVVGSAVEPFAVARGNPILYAYGQSDPTSSYIEISETYSTAFTDSVGVGGQTQPTQIRITPFPPLPEGARLTFESTATDPLSGATFTTLSGDPETVPRADGSTDVIYQFSSVPNSESLTESFRFNASLTQSPMAPAGGIQFQAALVPTGAASTLIPRYIERLVPIETELQTGSTELIFPFRIKAENAYTGIALTNPQNFRVKATLTAYCSDGTIVEGTGIVNPVTVNIPANGQYSRVASQIFADDFNKSCSGIIRVVANSAQLRGFYIQGDMSGPKLDGGNGQAEGLAGSYIPVIFQQGSNPFNFLESYNPGPSETRIRYELFDANGIRAAAEDIVVAPESFAVRDLCELFSSDLNSAQGGYVRASSPSPIVLRTLFGNARESNVLQSQLPSSEPVFFVPHFASGGQYATDLDLVNTSWFRTARLTFTLLDDTGTPIPIAGNPAAASINPGARFSRSIADIFPALGPGLTTGSIRVEVETIGPFGVTPGLAGAIRFYNVDGFASSSLPLVPNPARDFVFSQVAEGMGYYTGVAVQNSNEEAANFVLDVYTSEGILAGSYEESLPPHARLSRLISQLVPEASGQTGGYFRIRSDVPLASFALFGTTDLRSLSTITPQILR